MAVLYAGVILAGTRYRPPVFGHNEAGRADGILYVAAIPAAPTGGGTDTPDPPTDVVATPVGSHSMSVTFVPAPPVVGSPDTGYVVSSIPSGGVDTNSGSLATTHLVTGLTDGVSYVFTVHAINANGDSAESAPSAPQVSSIVIALILVDPSNNPRPNLTALKWAFFEETTPDLFNAPADRGIGETTDGSANLIIPVQTSLAAGDVGWLIITDSDGTVTQFPAHSAFSGPVTLS